MLPVPDKLYTSDSNSCFFIITLETSILVERMLRLSQMRNSCISCNSVEYLLVCIKKCLLYKSYLEGHPIFVKQSAQRHLYGLTDFFLCFPSSSLDFRLVKTVYMILSKVRKHCSKQSISYRSKIKNYFELNSNIVLVNNDDIINSLFRI